MRKFILKVALLGIIILSITLVIFYFSDQQAERQWGPNTRNQIETSFKNALSSDATCWLMGNSRIYRMNPDVIQNGHWYNFAHDNDTYNQMYFKLRYLLDHGCVVDTLVIGTDYFQFSFISDTRNYIYDDLLGRDYVKDYNNLYLKEFINNFKRVLITKQTVFGRNVLELGQNMVGGGVLSETPILRENGSYKNNETQAKENDIAYRDTTMLTVQIDYFKSILSLCKTKGIVVYVLMMPVRDNELKCYNEMFISDFNVFINNNLSDYGFHGHFLDFSNQPDFKDYHKYTDITHLNSESADEFTRFFYQELTKKKK